MIVVQVTVVDGLATVMDQEAKLILCAGDVPGWLHQWMQGQRQAWFFAGDTPCFSSGMVPLIREATSEDFYGRKPDPRAS